MVSAHLLITVNIHRVDSCGSRLEAFKYKSIQTGNIGDTNNWRYYSLLLCVNVREPKLFAVPGK
jgi:hypothetical protein